MQLPSDPLANRTTAAGPSASRSVLRKVALTFEVADEAGAIRVEGGDNIAAHVEGPNVRLSLLHCVR